MEKNIIGKVTDAKVSQGGGNLKGKALKAGTTVEFVTDINVVLDSMLWINNHSFQANYISINDEKKLVVEAIEIGYYAHKFHMKKDFDVRSLLDSDVDLITDPEIITNINKQSCWC